MMDIWITDYVGYDARGGSAEPFSSLENALESLRSAYRGWAVSLPSEMWYPEEYTNDFGETWHPFHSTEGTPCIYRRTLDPEES